MKTRILLGLLVIGGWVLPVTADDRSNAEFNTRLVNLQAADARQAAKLIQQTVMNRGRAGYEQATNSVVITGPANEVETAERLLGELDKSALRETGVRSSVIRMGHAPGDFLDLVHALISPGTSLSFDSSSGILVIRGKASDITEVERLVKVVSEKDPSPTRRAKPSR
jgi:type II secretory pathway component GspD/PulD (secretin)